MNLAQDILEDNGFKSRKYYALYVYWALVLVGYCGAIFWPTCAALFPMYWTALSVGLGGYYSVNLGHAYTATKASIKASTEETEPKA